MEYQNPNLSSGDQIEIIENENGVVPETAGEVTYTRVNEYTGQEIIHVRIEGHEYQLKSTSTKDVLKRPFGSKCGQDTIVISKQ